MFFRENKRKIVFFIRKVFFIYWFLIKVIYQILKSGGNNFPKNIFYKVLYIWSGKEMIDMLKIYVWLAFLESKFIDS